MSKHIYAIIFLLTILGFRATGQCPTTSTYFQSQDSINNFAANYPSCTSPDSLIIQGTDITSLANLTQITSVQHNLKIIDCDNLSTLNGLNNIQSIGGELLINENDNITTLDGLNNLQNIAGSLNITINNKLASIQALSNLSNIGYFLTFVLNPELTSLNGLESITSIGHGLIIGNNNKLTNLSGLDNIASIDDGPLVIAENYNLTSIAELSNLTFIKDSLNITLNTKLTSLNGLQNVTYIGRKVNIEGTAITNLIGLGKITAVHDSLLIENNKELTSLEGLTLLDTVDYLFIGYCPKLSSLSPLSTISHFNKSIEILDNGITNLTGLDGISNVHGNLAINYNGKLTSFEGLNNIKTIDGFFSFRNDSLLTDITALMNLDSVKGDFVFITENQSLTSLSGLDNMFYIGGSAINIENNPLLSTCGIPSICYHITYANFSSVKNNSPGCNNKSEIASTCGGPVIQGRVYNDANNNCIIEDGTEQPLANWPILVIQNQDTLIDYTDQLGSYKIFTPAAGTYTVTSIPPNYWTETCTGTATVSLSNNQDVEVVDFLGKVDTMCPVLSVDITNGHLSPSKQTQFTVNYCNNGTQHANDAQIEIKFSDAITINSSPIPYTALGDNTFLFDVGNVIIGHCSDFNIIGTIDANVIEQQAICTYATITPNDICTPPATAWSKASLEIKGKCDTDSIRFSIKNIGNGDMLATQAYDIIIEDWVILKTDINLGSGEAIKLAFPKTDSTYIIRGSQVPNHPGDSNPLVAIEGCTTNSTFSTGHVLEFPEDDNDLFKSIDCQEINTSLPASNQQNFPKGYGSQHYITKDQPIEYKINFHNDSQDTLRNMVIKEVLSPYLDLTTLQLGATSHPYNLNIVDDTLIFHMSDLAMAPADDDYIASFGFVKFKLTPKENLVTGTVITNTAALHYGPTMPIETNEVFNTIGENFVLVDISTIPKYISIDASPNPFLDYTTFHFDGINFRTAQINIFDVSGKLVRNEIINDTPFTLYKNGLTQGVYTFEILFDNQMKANGKLTVF